MPLSRVQPENYQALLEAKVATVTELLAAHRPPPAQIFSSPKTGFRLRAEFRMWHDDEDLNYVMFRRDDPKTPVTIHEFPIAHEAIQTLMPLLREQLQQSETLRRKIFQVEFLATLAGDMLISLIYHRKLDEAWEKEARELIATLSNSAPRLSIIGRSRKQKVIIGADSVHETLCIHGKEYHYLQYEQSFTQPNAVINTHMIEWACNAAAGSDGDLLELYCGNGNFTLPLARHFDNIIATELSKPGTRAARANIEDNNINNVQVVRLSAEEVTQAMANVRPFRRLQELPQPLHEYALNTLLVDPPRAGLDADTLKMATQFPTILYVSCNPQTLADNLKVLCESHKIEQFALFDQFPYTDHMECAVLLRQ